MLSIFNDKTPKTVCLTRTRMIVGVSEYYWRDILVIELKYKSDWFWLVLMLCTCIVGTLVAVGERFWLLLAIPPSFFPFLAFLKKLVKSRPDILIHHRNKDRKIKIAYLLSENDIDMTKEEIERLYVVIKKAHAERG